MDEKVIMEWCDRLASCGNSCFKPKDYLSGEFGEKQLDLLTGGTYRGIIRDEHEEFGGWAVYLPTRPSEPRLPAVVCVYNSNVPMTDLERLGFVELAQGGELAVITVQDGNSCEAVSGVVGLACERYRLDTERVYIAGHSFGGSAAARHALNRPDIFAGVCMLGTEYYGADTPSDKIAEAKRLALAVASVCGECEVNDVYPLNRDATRPAPPRVDPNITPPHHSADNCLNGLEMWRGLAGCTPVAREDDLDPRTEAERIIGARFDSSEERELYGRRHYICESNGVDGFPTLRYAAVSGGPHCVAPTAAELAWEHLRRFRRDAKTKRLCRVTLSSAIKSVTADTAYMPIGRMVTALRIELEENTDVSGLLPEDFRIHAFVDMHPVKHTKRVTGIDRTVPGTLVLYTEEFLLDATVPRYGYINGSPGSVIVGEFDLHCRMLPGGMSLDLKRGDVSVGEPKFAVKYVHERFEREGMMSFDYVRFISPHGDGRKLPVIFYSMGSGHLNNERNNRQILNHGAELLVSEEFQAVYPCHVVAPWFPMPTHPPKGEEGNRKLEEYGRSTASLMRSFAERVNADMSRLYFVGSGGGALYQHLAADPNLYAAAAMLTSVFDYFADGSEINYLRSAMMPIYITHAQSDYPCPVRRSRLAYSKLLEFGNRNVYYREYSDMELEKFGIDTKNLAGSHASSCLDLGDRAFYRWLFAQRL